MKTERLIARRYLFARKSHNVINVISAISATGLAVGSAALILILSVYNGFSGIISDNLSDIDPDVRIEPAGGLTFDPDSLPHLEKLTSDPAVRSITGTLEFSAFVNHGGKQAVVQIKGVDDEFEEESGIAGHITIGEALIRKGGVDMALVGSALASKLDANPRFVSPVEVHYPDRQKKISIANPESSLHTESLYPSGIFSISSELDGKMMIIPISAAFRLYGAEETSALEIRLHDNSPKSVRKFIREYSETVGEGYVLLDRYGQHTELFRMMRLEKAAVFLILILVVLIVGLNIYGSLSMLIMEKRDDIATLRAMGASEGMIRRIFVLEGWFVSVFGMVIGVAVGTALAVLQQKYGMVKMPGNYLVDAYPVIVRPLDIIMTAAGVAAVGLCIAFLSCRRSDALTCSDSGI